MTIKQYQKLQNIINENLAELEKVARAEGMNVLSPTFEEIIMKAKEKIIENSGFTVEEFRAASLSGDTLMDEAVVKNKIVQETQRRIEGLEKTHIPSAEEIRSIANEVVNELVPNMATEIAKQYIKAPEIINKIVKEITIKNDIDLSPLETRLSTLETRPERVIEAEEMREKLESLREDGRMDISSIKGVESILETKVDFLQKWSIQILDQRTSFLINKVANLAEQVNQATVNVGAIGGTITGGTAGSVLFINPTGILAQDNDQFFWDSTNNQLSLGTSSKLTPVFGSSQFPLNIAGNVNDYVAAVIQNLSSGDSAQTDFVVSADNDNSSLLGHYTDLGITGSGYVAASAGNVRTVSINAAGTGYGVGNILTLVGGDSNAKITVLTIGGGGTVTDVTVTDNGTGYSVASGLSVTGGTGSGATINVLSLVDYSAWGADDSYLYASGGNLVISTDGAAAGKVIKFTVNGVGTTNEVGRFTTAGLTVASGTAAAPSLGFTADTDGSGTGFYRAAANIIAVALNGTERIRFSTQGGNTANIQTVLYGIGAPAGTVTAHLGTNIAASAGGVGWGLASATPQAYTHRMAAPSRAGTDTDVAGANATLTSGEGTGAGAASSLIFQTPTVGSTGTTAQTMATRFTIATAANTTTVPIRGADGTASLPTYSFTSDATLGLYSAQANDVSITVGGSRRFAFVSSDFYMVGGGSMRMGASSDTILTPGGAAQLVLGAANAASPVAQTLRAQSSRPGTDTNVAGANLTITPGNGTGNVTGASLLFQTPVAVASGTGAQTQTTRLTLDSTGAIFAVPIIGTVQALSGAGAINITQLTTAYTSTGVLDALTLANGTAGQIKTIIHVVDGGSGLLTPTTPLGFATITFTNAGDSVTLQYFTQGWAIIGWKGVTIV